MNFKKINLMELNDMVYKLNTNALGIAVFDLDKNILELDFTGIPFEEDSMFKDVDFSTYLTFDPYIISSIAKITDNRVMLKYDNFKKQFGSASALALFQLSEIMVMKKITKNDKNDAVGMYNNEQDTEPRFVLMHKDFLHNNYEKLVEVLEIEKQKIIEKQQFSIKYNFKDGTVEMSDEFVKAIEDGRVDKDQLNSINEMIEKEKNEFEKQRENNRNIN